MKTKLFLLSLFSLCLANAQTLNFKHLSDMSVRIGAITSTIAGDNIYVSNGYKDSDGNATIIEKYSIKDNRWSVINPTFVPDVADFQSLTFLPL